MMPEDSCRRLCRCARYGVLLLFGLLPFVQNASGQVRVTVNRVHREWPLIRLEFNATYNGQPVYTTDSSLFRVWEDGVPIPAFSFQCPPPTVACLTSTALLFDAGPGMAGAPLTDAKTDGRYLVGLMAAGDEATILSVGPTVQTRLGWSADTVILRGSIDSLRVAPASAALWDAVYEGLSQLAAAASNPCRTLVVFTTGADSGSAHSMAECIALANQSRLRVFAVGLGGSVQTAALQDLANLTGGRFFLNPNPSQLTVIRQEVATLIFTGIQPCSITYEPRCTDGGTRTVDLAMVNYHGGSDTATCTFRAMRDTSGYQPLHLQLGSATLRGGRDTTLPLILADPVSETSNLYTATWTVSFDKSRLQFLGVVAEAGTLLQHVPFTVTSTVTGVRIVSTKKITLTPGSTPAVLAALRFRASDPESRDTVHCPVTLSDWEFEAGCFRPVLEGGEVNIVPRRPVVSASVNAPPSVEWSTQLRGYVPDVVDVRVSLTNAGDREARNTLCTLAYDTASFALAGPAAATIPSVPSTIAANGHAEALWVLRVQNRMTADSLPLCVTLLFDNHDSLRHCATVHVARAGAALVCDARVPVITADPAKQRYMPMPFDVTTRVRNDGGEAAAGVSVSIDVPPGLRAIGDERPGWQVQRIAASLAPGGEAEARWTLTHEPVIPAKEYAVVFRTTAENAAGRTCDTRIVIPALNAPVLAPTCTAPDSLRFNTTAGVYEPDPFVVTLACINRGNMPAASVRAALELPAQVRLADSADTFNRSISAALDPWKTGDSIPRVSWRLRTNVIPRRDTAFHIRVTIHGTTMSGLPLDSVSVPMRICVPGVAPVYASRLLAPDSLGRNAAETDVTPNPFVVTHRVWNSGHQTARLISAELELAPNQGIVFDAVTPARRGLNHTLRPGDTATVTWLLRAEKYHTQRLITVHATMTDEDGARIGDQRVLPIAYPRLALVSLLAPSCETPDSLSLDAASGAYAPNPFRVILRCVNRGGAPATDVRGILSLPPDVVLADPGDSLVRVFPSPMPEWTPGDTIPEVVWNVRYSGRPRFDRYADVRCSVVGVGTGGTVLDSVHVRRSVRVPGLAPTVIFGLVAPDTLRENSAHNDVEPNPFPVRAIFTNVSRQTGTIEHVELLVSPDAGVVFDPRTPRQRVIHTELAPGDSLAVPWLLRVQSSQVPRIVRLRAVAADVEGNIMELHRDVSVAGVLSPLTHSEALHIESGFVLHQNVPNPFSRATHITLDVPVATALRITIVDVLGRVVHILADRTVDAGRHVFDFTAGTLPPGLYHCRVDAAGFHDSVVMVLTR